MTYRLDSDILWSYGKVIDKRTSKVLAPDHNVEWRNPESVEGNNKHLLYLLFMSIHLTFLFIYFMKIKTFIHWF